MSNIIRLLDHKAVILPRISPLLLTSDLRKVIDEKVSLARKLKLINHTDFDEVVGVLSGYEFNVSHTHHFGGYCDVYGKRIVVSNDLPDRWRKPVICHEIGHSIQAGTGLMDNGSKLLSDLIHEEQQAETISYYLMKGLYPNSTLSPEYFASYFNMEDVQFLNDWYGEYAQNDLFTKLKLS